MVQDAEATVADVPEELHKRVTLRTAWYLQLKNKLKKQVMHYLKMKKPRSAAIGDLEAATVVMTKQRLKLKQALIELCEIEEIAQAKRSSGGESPRG